MKSTHTGECQICGSTQKLPAGLLSKHGYTVQWGFFSGICMGTNELPYEKSYALIEKGIENAKDSKIRIKAMIRTLEETGDTEFYKANEAPYHQFRRDALTESNNYVWITAIVTPKLNGNAVIKDKDGNEQTFYAGYPYQVETLVKHLRDLKIRDYMISLRQIDEYIEWQAGRIARWSLKELAPV